MKKKILVVEDEQSLRVALHDKLTLTGFEVLMAVNGEEGLKIALTEKPSIILLDIIMPVMDGLTMLEKLRQDKWGKKAKVIILTNLSDPDKVAESLKRGAYDFLVKAEWKISDLVDKIKSL